MKITTNFYMFLFFVCFSYRGMSQSLPERSVIDTSKCIKQLGQPMSWNNTKYSAIDFFNLIEKSDKSFSIDSYEIGGQTYKVYIPSIENYKSILELKGTVDVFAVPKVYPNHWMLEVTNGRNTYENIRVMSFKLWDKPFTKLIEDFDLYAFYIKEKDLEPYQYDSDVEGTTTGYEVRSKAEILLYKYVDKKGWCELDKIKLYGEYNAFTERCYIREFSLQKIREFVKKIKINRKPALDGIWLLN